MKDCWIREPEKRIGFTAVSMRLKDPYHNYDVPPSSDSEDGPEQAETTELGTESEGLVKREKDST